MLSIKPPDPRSVLLITLDSCRFDTFTAARTPNIRRVGELHRVMSPGNFTYASHAAMFVGFTPGDCNAKIPYVNPELGRIFYMRTQRKKPRPDYVALEGRNVIDGFRRRGFLTIGTGAMGWFNPEHETSSPLVRDFEHYWYAGNGRSLRKQVDFITKRLASNSGTAGWRGWFSGAKGGEAERPSFVFVNVGETHVPYWHEGADWDRHVNPCVPFSPKNDAAECRRRQTACLEFADATLGPLINAFLDAGATVVTCGDHGDCWGEDGLWEHSIHHPKVYEVPLLFNLSTAHTPVFS